MTRGASLALDALQGFASSGSEIKPVSEGRLPAAAYRKGTRQIRLRKTEHPFKTAGETRELRRECNSSARNTGYLPP